MNTTHITLRELVRPMRRLGRHVHHDARSHAFAVDETGPVSSARWDRHCPPFDQGNLGSCTGNAMAGLLMTGPFYVEGRELTEDDAVAIYSDATKLDQYAGTYPPDDTGSSGLAVMKAAKQRGYISGYRHAFSFRAALRALSMGPVITGINWYSGFDTPIGDAAVIEPTGDVRGGHELEVFELDVENGMIGLWNSWGLDWGDGGKCRMSFATFKRLLAERGDVTVAVK